MNCKIRFNIGIVPICAIFGVQSTDCCLSNTGSWGAVHLEIFEGVQIIIDNAIRTPLNSLNSRSQNKPTQGSIADTAKSSKLLSKCKRVSFDNDYKLSSLYRDGVVASMAVQK